MSEPAAKKKTIRELLISRMALVKYTAFGTYLECKSRDYTRDHPGCYIKDYEISSVEDKCKVIHFNETLLFGVC
jgi:hypothetical protein